MPHTTLERFHLKEDLSVAVIHDLRCFEFPHLIVKEVLRILILQNLFRLNLPARRFMGRVGLEPTAHGLRVRCATIAPPTRGKRGSFKPPRNSSYTEAGELVRNAVKRL